MKWHLKVGYTILVQVLVLVMQNAVLLYNAHGAVYPRSFSPFTFPSSIPSSGPTLPLPPFPAKYDSVMVLGRSGRRRRRPSRRRAGLLPFDRLRIVPPLIVLVHMKAGELIVLLVEARAGRRADRVHATALLPVFVFRTHLIAGLGQALAEAHVLGLTAERSLV